MATQIQWRRGNTAQTAAFTGAVAEVTVDTDKKTLVIHDGSTAGGTPLAKEGVLSTVYTHANGAFDKANSANVLAQAAYNQANTATTSAQAAFDKANQTAQLAFTTVSANGTSLVADANNDTLTITSAVANGVFAGFTGKRFCLSEPYLPHAWPIAYRITLEEDIVAIGASCGERYLSTPLAAQAVAEVMDAVAEDS